MWCCLEGPGIELESIRRLGIVGMGDVGLMMVLGLLLYGYRRIDELWIYEMDPQKKERLKRELGQIHSYAHRLPHIKMVEKEQLFQTDFFLFCAAGPIPAPGEAVKDVRMMQFHGNMEILNEYAFLAEKMSFKGLFGVVSDPVDRLATEVSRLMAWDPKRVMGFGQGVMYARARYHAGESVRIFGPHGALLYVANDPDHYDREKSLQITKMTVEENLRIRELGFKPYVAPALSSAALSIIDLLEGSWHHSSQFLGELHWGECYCFTKEGMWIQPLTDSALQRDVAARYEELKVSYET